MLDDLTPAEIVVLVQMISSIPDNVMVFNENNELTTFEHMPAAQSLGEKLNQASDRDDVKQYIEERYGK